MNIDMRRWSAYKAKNRLDKTDPLHAVLQQRTPTGQASRVRPAFGTRGTLDMALLGQTYGPHTAHAPRRMTGTFRVPLDVTSEQYRKIENLVIPRFVKMVESEGWELRPEYRIRVVAGRYPAPDLETGGFRPDEREMWVKAVFTMRKNPMHTIEFDGSLVDPISTQSPRTALAPGRDSTLEGAS